MDKGAWWVHRVTKSRNDWSNLARMHARNQFCEGGISNTQILAEETEIQIV